MCGIAGFVHKRAADRPVGEILLAMLGALARRGPDSAGVALFGPGRRGLQVCWVKLPERGQREVAEALLLERLSAVARLVAHEGIGGLVRATLAEGVDPAALCEAVEGLGPGYEVVSLGRHLELVKQVGSPQNLEATFHSSAFRGSHGIGHTRLSTESRVDLSHSQPFWARGVPDLAVVHNGHITNYHKLRRLYEEQGVRFFTENDSEVIGIYLAGELARGRSLEEALQSSLDDLDGSFTYLVATPSQLGYARDPFSFKPLIVVETEEYVAIANEEIAIRAALGDAGIAREPGGHEYRLWQRAAEAVAVGGQQW